MRDDYDHDQQPRRPLAPTGVRHFVEVDGVSRSLLITRAALEKIATNASTSRLVTAFADLIDPLAIAALRSTGPGDTARLDEADVPNPHANPEKYWGHRNR